MRKTRAIARLGLLALGLGIGGAIGTTPTMASANVADWLSSVSDSIGPLSAAAATPNLNIAIAVNGHVLYHHGDATAVADKGDYAIAIGQGSDAEAIGGTGNYASVNGVDSTAIAGGAGSSGNSAFVDGNSSYAWAGGTTDHPGTSDYAMIWGNNDTALAGSTDAASGNYDTAYVEGNSLGTADARGADYLADFVKYYGTDGSTSTTSAASETSHPILDLLSGSGASDSAHPFLDLLSGAGAAGDSVHPILDLLTGVDGGALADGGGLWADLVSSFGGGGGGLAADLSTIWTDLTTLF